ncbi:glucose-1-phosphate adenylyltransferase, partial [Striga asiatica]
MTVRTRSGGGLPRPPRSGEFAVIEQRLFSSFINQHRRPSLPSPIKPRTQPSAVKQTSPIPITVSVEPPSQIPATVGDPSSTRGTAAEPLSMSSPAGSWPMLVKERERRIAHMLLCQ